MWQDYSDFTRTLERELIATQDALKECGEALVQQHIAAMAIINNHAQVLSISEKADVLYNKILANPLVKKAMEGK